MTLILGYHSICSDWKSPLAIAPKDFQQHIRLLTKYFSLKPMTLKDAQEAGWPKGSFVLTFDDGYMDNYEEAFPILSEMVVNATFFVVTGMIGDNRDWGEMKKARRLMTWEQLREMDRAGMEIASHTESHADLSSISITESRKEMKRSKEVIEQKLGKTCSSFCFPYNRLNRELVKLMVEAGYRAGTATPTTQNMGVFVRKEPFAPRIGVYRASRIPLLYKISPIHQKLMTTGAYLSAWNIASGLAGSLARKS